MSAFLLAPGHARRGTHRQRALPALTRHRGNIGNMGMTTSPLVRCYWWPGA